MRTAWRIVLCLVAGFVLSVAVAWFAAVWSIQPGEIGGAAFTTYRLESKGLPDDLARVVPRYLNERYELAEWHELGERYEAGATGNRAHGWGLVREREYVRLVASEPAPVAPRAPEPPRRSPKALISSSTPW